MSNFYISQMQITDNYHNKMPFTSLRCPIKPFKIKTSKGDLYCCEIDYTKTYKDSFYKKIGEFFLNIFADTSSHPFWKKCRKPTLNKNIYINYVNSNIREYKKFFNDKDTTVLLVKTKKNKLVGAVYTRPLEIGKNIKDNLTLYIDSIAIDPKYRGLKIGKKLLTKILEKSKDKFAETFLVAYKESTPFYKKLNFTKMNNNDEAQKYAIKKLSETRIDYPEYADFMQKKLNLNTSDRWYERIRKNK